MSKNEVKEIKRTKKLLIDHNKEWKRIKNNTPTVTGGKMKTTILERVKKLQKEKAGFIYNNKPITAKEGVNIVKKRKVRVYFAEKIGKPALVFISDKN